MPKGKGDITVGEAGRRGGATTHTRYGREFYQKIGKKGGQATRTKHGPEFYEEIGRKGGQIVRELCARGKYIKAKDARRP